MNEQELREQIAKEIEEQIQNAQFLSSSRNKDTGDRWQLYYIAQGLEMSAAIARGTGDKN